MRRFLTLVLILMAGLAAATAAAPRRHRLPALPLFMSKATPRPLRQWRAPPSLGPRPPAAVLLADPQASRILATPTDVLEKLPPTHLIRLVL